MAQTPQYHQDTDSNASTNAASYDFSSYEPQTQSQQPKRRQRSRKSTKSRDWDTELEASGSGSGSMVVKPDASFVSPQIASATMQRFLARRVAEEGFEHAEGPALQRLELDVVAFIEQIFLRAKAYADIASRAGPCAADVLAAAEEYDLSAAELGKECKESARRARKRKRSGEPELSLGQELVPPTRRSASPELLPSDDEGTPPVIPQTLRSLPPHLPPLPPKHTYLRTPVPPPKKQALPSLEKKLENASLVQESLRSLLLATEIEADTNDGELFGGVVNWEATRHPRKKWKIGV
ncbi:hypothetical protein M0805_009667 [Coniferiporia weirii]|nr:hypothetical protein M0805_009667 [Coniferiporia weirii]